MLGDRDLKTAFEIAVIFKEVTDSDEEGQKTDKYSSF